MDYFRLMIQWTPVPVASRMHLVMKAVVNHSWWGVTVGYPLPSLASGIFLLGVANAVGTCSNHLGLTWW